MFEPRKIAIIGSRRRDSQADFEMCRQVFFEHYREGDTIVSGACPKGGDRFAEILAQEVGTDITLHKPEWDRYGRGAGIARNTLIAEDADIVIAVVAPDRTGGTEDTIRKAKKLGKTIVLVPQVKE